MSVINKLINKEYERQIRGIELIASENYTSQAVMDACGSILTNKYAEGYPGHRYYGGCSVVDDVEIYAIEQVKKLYGASYVNVQPHSGSHANMAVFRSVLKHGDNILGMSLNDGGHLTHGSPVSFSGIDYKAHSYGVGEDGYLDYEQIEKLAKKVKPGLIICGGSAYSRDWDYKRFRSIADSVGATLLADIAHPSGLIATGYLNNPINYAHIVTTTTHKTLRGPRSGLIMMGQDFPNPLGLTDRKGNVKMMSNLLDFTLFPGISGGPHMHTIAAKAVAVTEALDPSFKDYCRRVIANSRAMANEFIKLGYKVVSDGTDNHLFLLDLTDKGISGKKAERLLDEADITVNKNMVPFDKRSPFITSGVRIGSSAITTRGLDEDDCRKVVGLIDRVLRDEPINTVKLEVNNMMKEFPLFKV